MSFYLIEIKSTMWRAGYCTVFRKNDVIPKTLLCFWVRGCP